MIRNSLRGVMIGGIITEVVETSNGKSFTKKGIYVEHEGSEDKYYLSLFGIIADEATRMALMGGDVLDIEYEIKCRAWTNSNGVTSYFTNLDVVKLTMVKSYSDSSSNMMESFEENLSGPFNNGELDYHEDDLPF